MAGRLTEPPCQVVVGQPVDGGRYVGGGVGRLAELQVHRIADNRRGGGVGSRDRGAEPIRESDANGQRAKRRLGNDQRVRVVSDRRCERRICDSADQQLQFRRGRRAGDRPAQDSSFPSEAVAGDGRHVQRAARPRGGAEYRAAGSAYQRQHHDAGAGAGQRRHKLVAERPLAEQFLGILGAGDDQRPLVGDGDGLAGDAERRPGHRPVWAAET